ATDRWRFIAIRDCSAVSLFDLSSMRSMDAPASEILKCPFCELPLTTVDDADRHIRTAHRHEIHLPFGCSECGRRFMEIGQADDAFREEFFLPPYHHASCPSAAASAGASTPPDTARPTHRHTQKKI
ncbi:hypothetical protein PMAYCL1PPCAC_32665, partial [Pristionchus mayeri]